MIKKGGSKKLAVRISQILVLIIGITVPFVPTLIVIQMFFLIIPLGLICMVCLVWLLCGVLMKAVFNRKETIDLAKPLYVFSLLLIFTLPQIAATKIVESIQGIRSERIIDELDQLKLITGAYPDQYDIQMGIHYSKAENINAFKLTYEAGFLVTVEYNSISDSWNRYGWGD